jgi:CRISPR-associated protein Cmr4
MESRIYHLHALTALHAGTGQGTGVIDLPIAREKATYLPVVPGSSLKGVLRDELQGTLNEEESLALFGPVAENASEHAGALSVSDARLLCLPLRSIHGTFAWASCPMVLRRYVRDLKAVGIADYPPQIPEPAQEEQIKVTSASVLTGNNKVSRRPRSQCSTGRSHSSMGPGHCAVFVLTGTRVANAVPRTACSAA